jgi:hypothetical protein
MPMFRQCGNTGNIVDRIDVVAKCNPVRHQLHAGSRYTICFCNQRIFIREVFVKVPVDKFFGVMETDIPDFVLIEKDTKDTGTLRKECIVKGQDFIQVDKAVYGSLAIGGYLNSAFYAIRDLLYQYTSFNETISINCLPIYYLEPNTRIYVSDKRSGIDGEYVISSMYLPLDTTGTMTISANKVLDKI